MTQLRFMRNYANLEGVDFTASTEDSEFPASNLGEQLRSKVWRTTNTTAQGVIMDLKTTEEVDSIVVMFRKNQPITLTDAATIRIEGNPSPNFTTPLFSQVMTLDDENETISAFFSSSESYRYWRLYIDDPGSAYSYIEVSNFLVSLATTVADGIAQGFKWRDNDLSKSRSTPFGQRYYDVYPNQRSMSFDIPLAEYSAMETIIDFYRTVGSFETIAVGLDGQEALYDKDRFLVYGNLQKGLESVNSPGNYFNQSFSVLEQH